jgi:hypothetical protein
MGAHSHSANNSASATITYQSNTVTVTGKEALPPYMRVIVLKPDSAGEDLPPDALAFTDNETAPEKLSVADGTGGTVDLDGLFLLGAEPAGDGGATGGSTTHVHATTHSHTPNAHEHAETLCGASAIVYIYTTMTSAQVREPNHHMVALDSTVISNPDEAKPDTNSATSLPAYIKLLGLQNTSGEFTTPIGVVLPFLGVEEDIPPDWVMCDGAGGVLDCRDRQVRATTTAGEVGDTDASANEHSHTVPVHTHTHGSSHGHSTTIRFRAKIDARAGKGGPAVGDRFGSMDRHVHQPSWTVSQTLPTIQNNSDPTELESGDVRYNYRTVIWVKRITDLADRMGHIWDDPNIYPKYRTTQTPQQAS